MISIIVPVYNVEPYLRKCLDSIVNQTYKNLEILVIDDGSTDGSGKICDEYKKDERVKVFHTENHGLSAARNLGLDEAQGEWIGFVDSDDWIEPDMYEVLLSRAEETGADVVECGYYRDYLDKKKARSRENRQLSGTEAVHMLLHMELSDAVWNKLWKRQCFKSTRFPVPRVFEGYSTTYRVFLASGCICSVAASKYHYVHRMKSLSNTREMRYLADYWLAHRERYEFLRDRLDEDAERELLRFCALAAARTWAYYLDCGVDERKRNKCFICDMNSFVKQNILLFGDREWKCRLRIGVFFPHFLNSVSFRVAWLINRLVKSIN